MSIQTHGMRVDNEIQNQWKEQQFKLKQQLPQFPISFPLYFISAEIYSSITKSNKYT